MTPNNNVKWLRGVDLSLTDDSYELAKPDKCEIEQVINYQTSGRVFINQDLFEKMSLENQTALVLHESF